MKRLSKILMLVLVISLTCALFGIFSSAADEVAGVSTTTYADGNIDVSGVSQGTTKVVTTAGGNKYREWVTYSPSQLASKTDTQFRIGVSISNSYYVVEFDISSRTTLPEGFGYGFQVDPYDANFNQSEKGGTASDFFVVSGGKLTIGGKEVPAVEGSDWNHITIVYDFNPVTKTHEYVDGETQETVTKTYTDYSDTVVNVYADGKLMNTLTPFKGLNAWRVRRAWLGYSYSDDRMNSSPVGASVAIDNVVVTNCNSSYLGTEDASLADLFGEGAITDLANYTGSEIAYKANYQYPASDLGLLYVDNGGEKVPFRSLQDAIDALANCEVFGDIYLLDDEKSAQAHVTVPVTIYTGAYTIENEPTYADALTKAEDSYTYSLKEDAYTVEFYDGTFDEYMNVGLVPRTVLYFNKGQGATAPAWNALYDEAANKATLYNGWQVYDGAFELVGNDLSAVDGSAGYYYVFAEKTEIDVLFYTESGNTVTYYSSAADFVTANISGKNVVLVGDVVIDAPVSGATIDLNGHALVASGDLADGTTYIYNSSDEGAAVYASNGAMLTDPNDSDSTNFALYIGYSSSAVKVGNGRIFVTAQSFGGSKDDKHYFYNCDLVNVNGAYAQRGSWSDQIALRHTYNFEDCDIYLPIQTAFFHSNQISGEVLKFKNTNIYASAKGSFNMQNDKETSGSCTFDNSAVWGEFSWYQYSNVYTWAFTNGSKFNTALPENLKNNISTSGNLVAQKTETKTVTFTYAPTYGAEPVTFSHELSVNYVIEVAPAKATFEFYNKAFADLAEAEKIDSQVKNFGEAATAPMLSGAYNPITGKVSVVAYWEVYDSMYNKLGKLDEVVVTMEMDKQTYTVCPVFEQKDANFTITDGNNVTYYAASDFVPGVVNGKTIQLLSDVVFTEPVANVTIDLNGHALVASGNFSVTGTSYIYNSSATGASLYVSNGSLLGGESNSIYVGYSNAETKVDTGRILVVAHTLGPNKNNYKYFYNCDLVNVDGPYDRRASWNGGGNLYNTTAFENCDIYLTVKTAFLNSNALSSANALYFKNTNIYAAAGGSFTMQQDKEGNPTATFDNSSVWGAFGWMEWSNVYTWTFTNGSKFNTALPKDLATVLPDGSWVGTKTETKTVTFTYAPTYGAEPVTFEHTLSVNYVVEEAPAMATFEFFDKAFGENGTLKATELVNLGAIANAPKIDAVYSELTGKVTRVAYWEVYENGTKVGKLDDCAVTDEMDQKTYQVYPVFEQADAGFVIIDGETRTYYDVADFTSAFISGKKVQLLADVTLDAPASNVTIDLNGHALVAVTGVTNGGTNYIYNSAAGTAAIYASNGTMIAAATSIGYSAAETKVTAGRITVVAHQLGVVTDTAIRYYNCDLVNVDGPYERRQSWFGQMNMYGSVSFENCDFYLTVATHMMNTNLPELSQKENPNSYAPDRMNLYFTGCNIYAAADGWLMGQADNALAPSAPDIYFDNTSVYGAMSWYGNNGNIWTYHFTNTCKFTTALGADLKTSIGEGFWLVNKTETKTVTFTYCPAYGAEPVTFTQEFTVNYAVEEAPAQATFEFFDKAFGEDGTLKSTVVVNLGSIANAPKLPTITNDDVMFIGVAYWEVYDQDGNKVGTLDECAVTDAMDKKTYKVYPVFVEKEIAFATFEGEEIVYRAAEDFVPAVVNGQKVMLLSDITTDLEFNNVNIDLFGYSLVSTGTYLLTGDQNFIYNSADMPARFGAQQGVLSTELTADGKSVYYAVYFGYQAKDTKAAGRITMNVGGKFCGGKNYNTVWFYNVDYVNTVTHDRGSDSDVLFYMNVYRSLTVNVENSNFYGVAPVSLIGGNQSGAQHFHVSFKDTSFYGQVSVFGGLSNRYDDSTNEATFENVHFYDNSYVFGNGLNLTFAGRILPQFDANCTFSNGVSVDNFYLPEGLIYILNANAKKNVKFDYITADGQAGTFEAVCESPIALGTEADLKAQFQSFYRNVNIDVDINFNLYVPVNYSILWMSGAQQNGTQMIGDAEYYVLTVKQAPKDAYKSVAINFGANVSYAADVTSYAGALLRLTSNTEYVTDSQAMVKYILYYIKTTALDADFEADVSALTDLLGDFVLTEEDKALTEDTVDASKLNTVFAESYLDLKSQVGIVFKVNPDFVGKITVTMEGIEPIVREYTEAAGEDKYIIIGNIPVFKFRNTITVFVGDEEVASYNLATYVQNKQTDVAYAAYAYSKAASAYHAKHSTPTTTD